MLDYEIYKPVRNFGLFIGIIGVFGIIYHITSIKDPQYTIGFQAFIIILSFFFLVIGWNIVTRNRWGFKSLKLILYLLYPAYPFGYYFAKRTFRYIELNNIQKFFKKSIKL